MGNCQAIDNASLVIQHQSGRVERLYWAVTASEVMKLNPGHYVALLLTTTLYHSPTTKPNNNSVRITRIKLLRPTDTLTLGHAYRLITTHEVMKGLWAKKYGKMNNKEVESGGKLPEGSETRSDELEKTHQKKSERQRHRNSTSAKPKGWHPSLKSISEADS